MPDRVVAADLDILLPDCCHWYPPSGCPYSRMRARARGLLIPRAYSLFAFESFLLVAPVSCGARPVLRFRDGLGARSRCDLKELALLRLHSWSQSRSLRGPSTQIG